MLFAICLLPPEDQFLEDIDTISFIFITFASRLALGDLFIKLEK